MEQKTGKRGRKKKVGPKKKPNLVGWSLNDITQRQIQKMAARFRVKKVKAVYKMFDILFTELVDSKDFRNFVEMYDRLQDKELPAETSVYSSFDIEPGYMERFMDIMYQFDYVDRSPFLRILVDYIFQKYSEPLTDVMDQIKKDLKDKGYKVKGITPALLGDIFIQIEAPKSAKR